MEVGIINRLLFACTHRSYLPVGQGVWYALTHYPDKIIGGAPVSAYSSIQGEKKLSTSIWSSFLVPLYPPSSAS